MPPGLEPLSCRGAANFMQVLRTWQLSLFFPGAARPNSGTELPRCFFPLHTEAGEEMCRTPTQKRLPGESAPPSQKTPNNGGRTRSCFHVLL